MQTESRLPMFVGALFLVTLMVLVGLIALVVIEGELKSMMALSAVAYAMASLGFLATIAWVYFRGQFANYERIKDDIFELEKRR